MSYHKLFCTHVVEKYSSVYSTFQYTLSSVIKTSCMFCMDTLHNSLKSASISPAKYFFIFSTNKHLKYTVQIIYQNFLFLTSFSHSKLFFSYMFDTKKRFIFFFRTFVSNLPYITTPPPFFPHCHWANKISLDSYVQKLITPTKVIGRTD